MFSIQNNVCRNTISQKHHIQSWKQYLRWTCWIFPVHDRFDEFAGLLQCVNCSGCMVRSPWKLGLRNMQNMYYTIKVFVECSSLFPMCIHWPPPSYDNFSYSVYKAILMPAKCGVKLKPTKSVFGFCKCRKSSKTTDTAGSEYSFKKYIWTAYLLGTLILWIILYHLSKLIIFGVTQPMHGLKVIEWLLNDNEAVYTSLL